MFVPQEAGDGVELKRNASNGNCVLTTCFDSIFQLSSIKFVDFYCIIFAWASLQVVVYS